MKDMDVLLKCDSLNPGSLSEIMDKSRTHTIVLDKEWEKGLKNWFHLQFVEKNDWILLRDNEMSL